MIEGLKIKVTPAELTKHMTERAAYHRKRADDKEAQLPALRDAAARIKDAAGLNPTALGVMNKSSAHYHTDVDDTVTSLERDIKDHRNKALAFEFFASHLFAEDYTLVEADLIRLEILNRQ